MNVPVHSEFRLPNEYERIVYPEFRMNTNASFIPDSEFRISHFNREQRQLQTNLFVKPIHHHWRKNEKLAKDVKKEEITKDGKKETIKDVNNYKNVEFI